jgi:hypothetical protein
MMEAQWWMVLVGLMAGAIIGFFCAVLLVAAGRETGGTCLSGFWEVVTGPDNTIVALFRDRHEEWAEDFTSVFCEGGRVSSVYANIEMFDSEDMAICEAYKPNPKDPVCDVAGGVA